MSENAKNAQKNAKNNEKIVKNNEKMQKTNEIVKVKFLRDYCGLHGVFKNGQSVELKEDVANRLVSTQAVIKEV